MCVSGDDRIDGRVLHRVGDADDRAVPRHAGALPSTVLAPCAAPWWITTTCTLTPCWRSFSDSALIARPRRGTSSPSVAPAATSSGVLSTVRRRSRRSGCRCTVNTWCPAPMSGFCPVRLVDDVGRRGTGIWRAPDVAAAARRRSRTRGCRTTWRRDPTRSPRRSRRVLEQGRVRRRCADVVTGGEQQGAASGRPRRPRRTSSRAVRRRRPARSVRRSAWSSGRADRGSR